MVALVVNPTDNVSAGGEDAGGAWLALALVCGVALSYGGRLLDLADVWSHQHAYTHGFLTVPLVLFLVWRQRGRLVVEANAPVRIAALLVAVVSLVVAAASLAAIDVLCYAILPIICWLVILGVLGLGAARAVALPLATFWFAVPFWGVLASPLQLTTAYVSGVVVSLFGVPAYVHGMFIAVPLGNFEVAEGCSGLNFFVVSLTLATLFGHLQSWPWRRRLAFTAIAIALAMVANWLRVIIIILVASWTRMQTSLLTDHYVFGWWLFAGCLVVLMLIARWMDRVPAPSVAPGSIRADAPVPVRARVALLGALVLAGPLWAALVDRTGHAASPAFVRLPAPPPGWIGPLADTPGWRPVFPGAAEERLGAYQSPASEVLIYRVAYDHESRGRKLVGEASRLEGADGWQVRSDGDAMAGFRASWPLREKIFEAPNHDCWLVVYWFEVDGRRIGRPSQVKMLEAMRVFRGRGVSGLSAIAVRCARDCTMDVDRSVFAPFLASWPQVTE